MAIYIGTNKDIKFYKGDSGNIKIEGLPTDKNYDVYFTARDYTKDTVVIEKKVQSNKENFVIFSFSAADTDLFKLGKGAPFTIYKWGIKICDPETGMEDTLVPAVTIDESGNPVFAKPARIYVYPLYVEGELNNAQ